MIIQSIRIKEGFAEDIYGKHTHEGYTPHELTPIIQSLGYLSYRCAMEIANIKIRPHIVERNLNLRKAVFDK